MGRHRQDRRPAIGPDVLAGIESRGFLVAAPLGPETRLRFRHGAQDRASFRAPPFDHEYALEYGTDTIEIQEDAVEEGQRIVILDDLLATGGTMAASVELFRNVGAYVVGVACIIELAFLEGRSKLDVPFSSLVSYDE